MPTGHRGTSEDKLRTRFRVASFVVILALLILTVTADTLGRLLVDSEFHSSEAIVLSLVGAILGYATIETVALLQPRKDRDE